MEPDTTGTCETGLLEKLILWHASASCALKISVAEKSTSGQSGSKCYHGATWTQQSSNTRQSPCARLKLGKDQEKYIGTDEAQEHESPHPHIDTGTPSTQLESLLREAAQPPNVHIV